ncbi:TRAP transporter small permease subunit [Agarivorans sp. B2Z047]|uniref:TRAP transporter small permease subunit n=1 Tax=Agarivorans sp. B2Z047 TaxID=2652721 RepID=UPI00128E4571|nr:TRAP transporter small permease subunit [Agarivorans sp. B2Z047]MPW30963.1 TRAP transporter small permease subunit [Agarivorans sp. B2Z047]UQN40810.1 TRAP transporter small permease subunit [Agarivorans sp. B2Z047]
MPSFIIAYVKYVDAFNRRVGRLMMYGIFLIVGVLMWSSVSKTFFMPSLWTLESAQFMMVAYYIIGSAYAMQLNANVRMDLFYGNWSIKKRAWVDAFTIFFLIFYLIVLLYGGLESTLYSLEYSQRTRSAWRPLLWPIKALMCTGFVMMILQAISQLIKDIAVIRGVQIK